MTSEQKINPWLVFAAAMVAGIICGIVADQTKTNMANQALETPCPVASQSASSQPLPTVSVFVYEIPMPIPSSKKPIPTLKLRDITIRGIPDPDVTKCFYGTTCECAEENQVCHDAKLNLDFICSKGLVFIKEEYLLWGNDAYRDACRLSGQPKLKLCTLGASCAYQSLKEQEKCFDGNDDRLSICLCGLVFDYSTPQLRFILASLACLKQPARDKSPPDPSLHL